MKTVVLTILFALTFANYEGYFRWKSYTVVPSSDEQVKSLNALKNELELDFWSPALVQREGIVLVKSQYRDKFVNYLKKLRIKHKIHTEDVEKQLERDGKTFEVWTRQSFTGLSNKALPYNSYQPVNEIYKYMADIASRYMNTTILVTRGHSFEGRPLRYLQISTTNFQNRNKPVIFIDGGIHAREWIAPPTVTWAIRKLTEDVTDSDLLHNFDWILMPVVNPDGYEYSFNHERLWRMTRSTDTHVFSNSCPGVDGNRNYGYLWNTVGSSADPCEEDYAGDRAFSEFETQAVRDILNEHLSRIALYISMHSYGSMILYPWSHNNSSPTGKLHRIAIRMADAITHASVLKGRRYVYGNAPSLVKYAASGTSADYAQSIGVPLSFTYELPGPSGGDKGFHLHPRDIEKVCRETWAGISVGAWEAEKIFKNRRSFRSGNQGFAF